MIDFNRNLCIDCGECVIACSAYCFQEDEDRKVKLRYPDECNSCGHCVAVCPTGAVSLPGLPADDFRPWTQPEISPEDLKSLMVGRRSIRVYEERQVPEEDIRSLLEAACHAGTASNGQSEGFIVLQDRAKMEELELTAVDALWNAGIRLLGIGPVRWIMGRILSPELVRQYTAYHDRMKRHRKKDGGKGLIFRNAPTVLVVHGPKRSMMAGSDAGIALRNVELLAASMGLGTCWVGFLQAAASKSKKVNRLLGLPKGRTVVGTLMIGYPQEHYSKTIPRRDRTTAWI